MWSGQLSPLFFTADAHWACPRARTWICIPRPPPRRVHTAVLHHGDVVALLLETGLWRRHRIDQVLGLDTLGAIYCMLPPIAFGAASHDPEIHPPVKLMVWVSDPEMVRQVLMVGTCCSFHLLRVATDLNELLPAVCVCV